MQIKTRKWICLSVLALIASSLLTWFCYNIIEKKDRTNINIITIVGTVLAVVGIVITIVQQIQIISVADAIKQTTIDIDKQIMDTIFETNIICAIKCLDKIVNCFDKDKNATSIKLKLDDLHDHVLDCRKLIEKYNNSNLGNNPNFTSEKLTTLCEADKKITRYETLILTTDYSITKLKENETKSEFTTFIVELKRDFNLMKKIQYSV